MAVAAPGFRSFMVVVPERGGRTVAGGGRVMITCRSAGGGAAVCTTSKPGKVNYYKVLSLESETASAQEIKRAYRRLARRLHPDVCPPERKEESSRALVEVNRAYEALSDPVLRVHHDAELGLVGREAGGRRVARREVWEWQLSELARRSTVRARRKERGAAPPVAW